MNDPRGASRTLRITLEYSGAGFAGWQVQPEARTVQGELERALAEITREPVRVAGASRTDAGVHALGQVASCETTCSLPGEKLRAGLNALLPADVAVSAVEDAPPGFHARFSALGKHYRYALLSRPARAPLAAQDAWHVPWSLDVAAMQAAAGHLLGRRDFRAFVTRSEGREEEGAEDCVRTLTRLDVSATPAPGAGGGLRVEVDVVGDAFLYKMVRTLVGTLCQVGRGRRPAQDLAGLLLSGDRRRAGPTAPPHGLCLVRVAYAPGELPGLTERSRREAAPMGASD